MNPCSVFLDVSGDKGIEIVKQNIPKNPEIILVFNEIYLEKNMPRKLKTKFGQLIVSPNTKSGLYTGKYWMKKPSAVNTAFHGSRFSIPNRTNSIQKVNLDLKEVKQYIAFYHLSYQ